MMWWRIYYANDFVFTDQDGSPYDAPSRGVVVITQADPINGYRTVKGDFYIKQIWGWEGCDLFGLWDYLADYGAKTVKFGRTLDNPDYERIFQKALMEAAQ